LVAITRSCRVGRQRPPDQFVRPDITEPVEAGGVDVVHAELHGAVRQRHCRLKGRRPAAERQPHRAEAEPVDPQVTTQQDRDPAGQIALVGAAGAFGERFLRHGKRFQSLPCNSGVDMIIDSPARSAQFLAESLLLSEGGGVAGVMLGAAITAAVATQQRWTLELPALAI
jgi:hypothetical protein